MHNVEGTSKYEYTYTITENDYPCEWYVSGIEARDVYNNTLYTHNETQTSGAEIPLTYNYYFNVIQNGTFVQPNVNVTFRYINADMEWDNKTIEVPRRTKVSKTLENVDIGVKFDDAEITGWSMVGYPDLDTIVTMTMFLANYNTNIVEKYVYSSYLPGVGVKCLYKETSFVKKGQKIELPTVISGAKNVKWDETEELDELIKNGYIINTDTGTYYFEASAEVDDSVPPTDDNNGITDDDNNQTTTDGNKGNNEGTKLSSDKIQEAVASITTAKAGDTYTVDMSEATVVPKDVLEAAKGKDVDIVLDMNGYEYAVVIADNAVTTDNADNTATSSIATGDSSPIVLYAVLCVIAIALAGIAVVTRKKNA